MFGPYVKDFLPVLYSLFAYLISCFGDFDGEKLMFILLNLIILEISAMKIDILGCAL